MRRKGEREEKRVSFLSWLTVGVGHSGVEKEKRKRKEGGEKELGETSGEQKRIESFGVRAREGEERPIRF